MADIVEPAVRSRIMAAIKGKDTKPERSFRRALHARGFRFRLNVRNLPGRPDIVLPRHKVVFFVHGCFWHRHDGCAKATTPSTRPEFWQAKFDANVRRDRERIRDLIERGWRVGVVWECNVGREPDIGLIDDVDDFIRKGTTAFREWPAAVSENGLREALLCNS